MSKLASLINKYGLEEHDVIDIMDCIKKSNGDEAVGLALWAKSIDDNLEDMRFQLKAKGCNVDVIKDESPSNEA